MKITLISEDFPLGRDVDWPAVPGTGDHIAFRYRGGTVPVRVDRVEWHVEGDSDLSTVTVFLSD